MPQESINPSTMATEGWSVGRWEVATVFSFEQRRPSWADGWPRFNVRGWERRWN